MTYEKRKLCYAGKAKSLYATDDADLLIAEFRDDTTAFDGAKKEALADKGRVNHALSNFFMAYLAEQGIATHWLQSLSPTSSLVRRLQMIPLECVVRNIAAGSLCRRLGVAEKRVLTPPLFELFLKDDELHDPLVTSEHALCFGWATLAQLTQMRQLTLQINALLQALFLKADLILVDAKFEFGLYQDQIILGDEISPDSCRIWDKKTMRSLDKDRFRQDLGGVVDAYQEIAERLGIATEAANEALD